MGGVWEALGRFEKSFWQFFGHFFRNLFYFFAHLNQCCFRFAIFENIDFSVKRFVGVLGTTICDARNSAGEFFGVHGTTALEYECEIWLAVFRGARHYPLPH